MRFGLAVAAAAMLLGACDVVTSKEPLFTAADEAGAPRLRDGVWMETSGKCRLDSRKPLHAWPVCASGHVVRGGEILSWEADEKAWSRGPYILAAGDPRILQLPSDRDGRFSYLVVMPEAPAAEGGVAAYRAGPIFCSSESNPPGLRKTEEVAVAKAKPNEPAEREAEGRLLPARALPLFAGFVREDESAGGCITRSSEAIRNAARAMATDRMSYLKALKAEAVAAGRSSAEADSLAEEQALWMSLRWVRPVDRRDNLPK